MGAARALRKEFTVCQHLEEALQRQYTQGAILQFRRAVANQVGNTVMTVKQYADVLVS